MNNEITGWISNITKTTVRARMIPARGSSEQTVIIASQMAMLARLREVGRATEAQADLWEVSDVRNMDRELVVTWKKKK